MSGRKIKAKLITVPDDAENATLFTKKIRRNDPCPCGSGKKAKNCCGTERGYSYIKHINYVRREENLTHFELFKVRTVDGQRKEISRFCYEIDQPVVANDTFEDESLRGKAAIIIGRGLDHDHLDPYYEIVFCEDTSRDRYNKWVSELHLSPLIV